jgi:hypothetical protein
VEEFEDWLSAIAPRGASQSANRPVTAARRIGRIGNSLRVGKGG